MAKRIERLPEDKEELAFDLVLEGNTLETIAKRIGLTSAQSLQRYMMKFPEFMELFDRARVAECIQIEEDYRHILDNHSAEGARVQEVILSKLLKWRDQRKYGDKTQIDMSMTIDISGALDRAEKRVLEIASNVIALPEKTKID